MYFLCGQYNKRSRFSKLVNEIVANAEVWRAVNSALRSFGRTPSVGNTDGVSVEFSSP